jgi:hypothetical protein
MCGLIRGTPSNKRMNLTKRGLLLVGGPALARQRRAVFTKSRFAGYPRCYPDAASTVGAHSDRQ